MVRRYVGNGVWEDVPGTVTPQNSLEVALEDVATRFLTHLPATELRTADRLFFQIEQAHWFYEDFLADAPGAKQGSTRERNSQLQRLRSRPFSTRFG